MEKQLATAQEFSNLVEFSWMDSIFSNLQKFYDLNNNNETQFFTKNDIEDIKDFFETLAENKIIEAKNVQKKNYKYKNK